MKSKTRIRFLFPLLVATSLAALVLRAEEGAGGHYMPGATASFIDALPGKPSFVAANLFTYYDGSASASRPFRFGGQTVADVHATAYADTIVGLYITKVGKADLAAEVKWLPELDFEKRLKGDTIWFKVGLVF